MVKIPKPLIRSTATGRSDEVVVADEDEVEARGAIIRAVASIARFMLLGGNCGGYSDLPVPG